MSITNFILLLIKFNINKGANFCQVRIKNNINQVICFVMFGNQKCNGTPPSFKIKDSIINVDSNLLLNMEYHDILYLYNINDDIIKMLDLILWIIKYFIEASASIVLPLIFIKGKNLLN